MGQYDTLMKLLVDAIPETIAQFSLHEWQKYEHLVPEKVQITNVAQLSTDFKSDELEGDNVLLIEGPEGPLYLLEIEFQSTLDTSMPLRSLEYLIRAKKKHWKKYGQLPVVAVVIYLFAADDEVPVSPMHWPAPYGRTTMDFHSVSIQLKDLPRFELLAFDEPIWPLALLTGEPINRILIQRMVVELVEKKLYKLLPISQTVASWVLEKGEFAWLNQEYQEMFDIIKDSPAYKLMKEQTHQELIPEYEQKVLEERKKAEEERKQLLEEQKQKEKKTLATWRRTVVVLVSERFPTLQPREEDGLAYGGRTFWLTPFYLDIGPIEIAFPLDEVLPDYLDRGCDDGGGTDCQTHSVFPPSL